MTDKKVLVIDDSATIRKLVESHLGTAGYDVTCAPNAEDGLRLAQSICPDLILLDHQLPGTTGLEVCKQLIQIPALQQTPVVISSTLRKKAYVEYADLDNVVDMLPKPYTEDLLITTVANAIETAAMVLASQSMGAAVPEIIGDPSDSDIQGSFAMFELREILDMLNNGQKTGALELAGEKLRLWIYLDNGRVQGISASGITPAEIEEMISRMPESLSNLAQVLKLMVANRGSAEFESFLQLLDRRVIDPRLTSRLLRFQAAQLMGLAFKRKLTNFEFRGSNELPGINKSLPLDISVMALLIENAMHLSDSELGPENANDVYSRKTIRGQNLDRAGLSARHMKVLNLLAEPVSTSELAERLGWERDEARRVLHGLLAAGVLEKKTATLVSKFVLYEPTTAIASQVRSEIQQHQGDFLGKVVRDSLTLQLLVKRAKPDVVFFSIEDLAACESIREMASADNNIYANTRRVVLLPETFANDHSIDWVQQIGFQPNQILAAPYKLNTLLDELQRMPDETTVPQPAASTEPSPIVVSVEIKPGNSIEVAK